METEKRGCANCKIEFIIEPDDFTFYQKIEVPAPTWCPSCRRQRSFSWRSEWSLHKNKCAKTGRELISGFAPDSGITVYERDLWWADDWDPLEFGATYDFEKPFFIQFSELFRRVPQPAVFNTLTVNCTYTQHTGEFKNAYLVFASWSGENVTYGARAIETKDSMDVYVVGKCEFCYQSVEAVKCSRVFFSQKVENCNDSSFLFNCKGCTDCFGCTNLRNKSYYLFNKPYSKEEYKKEVEKLNLGSYKNLEEVKMKFTELKQNSLHKFANINNSENVTGDNITNSFNCTECFDVVGEVRNCKFTHNALTLKDSYDGYGVGANAELLCEVFDAGVKGAKQCFGGIIYGCMSAYYCYNCHNASNIFGCIGLRKKDYCILNKQYSKEEYEKLIPKVREHMKEMPYTDKKGRIHSYGEFFPTELSPFAYNESIAQEHFPLTKEEVLEKGYKWRDPEKRHYEITMKTEDIPDHIKDVQDSITKEIIGCEHKGTCNEACTTAFKIIPQELQFYQRMHLPLPRLCPNCRHYQRFKLRNPTKLWNRKCQCAGTESDNKMYENDSQHFHGTEHCPNEFETTYAPERKETIYCEQCYNSEVV
jgi:hypothetical protein